MKKMKRVGWAEIQYGAIGKERFVQTWLRRGKPKRKIGPFVSNRFIPLYCNSDDLKAERNTKELSPPTR